MVMKGSHEKENQMILREFYISLFIIRTHTVLSYGGFFGLLLIQISHASR